MDAGHVRNLTWAQDNDSKKWVAYNKMRGQYMSALEGAIPERIFNDTSKCNIVGSPQQIQGLPNCNQGISAIKALQVAASQGQKIYTITQAVYASNPNIVNSALSAHSATTKQAISNALDAGMEVTIHERPITIDGWTGAGYTKIDPNTGAGGYMIDGGGNGGVLNILDTLMSIINYLIYPKGVVNGILAGVSHKLLDSLGNFLGLAGYILDVFKIMNTCMDDGWIIMIDYMLLTMIGLAFVGLLTAVVGGGLIVGIVVGVLIGMIWNLAMDIIFKPWLFKSCNG